MTLLRQSAGGAELKAAPKAFFRKEEELISGCGYNEFGQLNQGNFADTSAPVLCEKKKMANWDLKGRIQTVACGWYHTVIITRQKWSTTLPQEFNKHDLKNENLLSTEEVASTHPIFLF